MPDSDYVAAALARRLMTASIIQPPFVSGAANILNSAGSIAWSSSVVSPSSTLIQLNAGAIRDAGGNSLADPLGVLSSAITKPVTDQNTGSINQSFTAVGISNAVDVTNSAFTLTLTRAVYVLFIATATIGVTAGGSDFAQMFLSVDGAQAGPLGGCGFLVNEFSVSTIIAVPLLAVGAHACKLKAYVGTAGNTGEITQADTVAIQLGS